MNWQCKWCNKSEGVFGNEFCSTECETHFNKFPVSRKGKRKKKKARAKANKLKIKTSAKDFYESDAWRSVRYEVLKKFKRMCMVCFRTETELHVDHIKPRSKFPNLQLEPSNLQILCKDCNLGKGNKDEIDWR